MLNEITSAIGDPANDAIELTRRCLVLARARRKDFDLAKQSEPVIVRSAEARKRMGVALGGRHVPIDLTPQSRAELCRILESAVGGVDSELLQGLEAVLAHDLALALEEVFGARFFDHLAAAGARELGSDDLVPLLSPFSEKDGPMRRAYRDDLAPRPSNLGVAPDSLLTRARLTPDVPHSARLRWIPSWASLDELGPESLVAVVSPGEFSDLDIPTSDGEHGPRFFGARPRDATKRRDAARSLVEQADRAGAHVVVLPELSLDEQAQADVAEWIELHANSIRVAVCGSAHRDVDGDRQNVAFVAARRHSPDYQRIEQTKIVPFVWRTPEKNYVEDIRRPGRVVSLLTGRRWSLLVLICMDFIDRDLARFAEDIRPTLVLVPACSETTGVFRSTAELIASRAQGHAVIANQPVPGGKKAAAAGIVSRPRRERTVHVVPTGTPPETHWATLAHGRWRRHP